MIGIVVGLEAEARAIRKAAMQAGMPVPLIRVAPGPDAAAQAAKILVQEKVTHLLSAGVAGALAPDLDTGDIVLADGMANGPQADAAWIGKLTHALPDILHKGPLIGADGVVAEISERQALRTAYPGVLAVDTETAALADVAHGHGLPWTALRVILDRADQTLPNAAIAAFQPGQGIHMRRLIMALMARPSDLAGLIRLGRQQSQALQILRMVIPAVLQT